MELNHYRFDPAFLSQYKGSFEFDLFGSALHSLAPNFPSSLAYRFRQLAEVPAHPLISVAAPPWNRILHLLSAALADPGAIKGKLLVILPLW